MNRPTTTTRRTRHGVIRAVAAAGLALAAGAAAMPLAGCSGLPDAIDNPTTITGSDWRAFSDVVWDRLESSGVLETYRDEFGRPPTIAVGSFDNNTSNPVFARTKNFLYNNLQPRIINSGAATLNRDISGNAGTRESLLDDIGRLRNDPAYDSATFNEGVADIPDLILFGSIDADRQTSGRVTQEDFLINLELIDTEKRTAQWADVINVTKLWKRPLF